MASFTIPEDIVGIPLFVPDAYNQFSVVAGGMPNGDDCLRVRGDLGDYKAFIPAPDITPNWFRSRQAGGSMTFWFKSSDATSGSDQQDVIMGSMRYDCNTTNPFNSNQTNFAWMIGASGTTGMRVAASSGTQAIAWTDCRDGNWHLICMQQTSNVYRIYVDDNVGNSGASTVDTTPAPDQTAQFFCIGSYSDGSNMGSWDGDFQIGKIGVHDHLLTQTERSMLYNTMVP